MTLEQANEAPAPSAADSRHVICDNLVRIYQTEGVEVVALQGLDLTVEAGELVAIVGASGSGKSTLLNILSGNDVQTAGRAWVAGNDLLEMSARDRVIYRRDVAGFVWQQTARGLLPFLTAAENVALPILLTRAGRTEWTRRAEDLLELLGIAYCRDRRPAEMSGGEQQRCAIAVAVANRPQVLSSPTSPPVSSTRRPRTRCSPRCVRRTRSSAPRSSSSRTTRPWPARWTGRWRSGTGAPRARCYAAPSSRPRDTSA